MYKRQALPYDVYNREEARQAVEGKPLSFLNIDRPETMFAPDQDMYAPEVYEAARQRLEEQEQAGVYIKEEQPVYYLYELTMDGRSQTGLVACASIDEYENHVIKKHENTRAEKEADRIRHVDVCLSLIHILKLISSRTEKGIQFDFPGYESVAFWTPIKKDAPFLCIEPWCGGTMDQVPCTDMLKKKYVQFLQAGAARDYVFSFKPC